MHAAHAWGMPEWKAPFQYPYAIRTRGAANCCAWNNTLAGATRALSAVPIALSVWVELDYFCRLYILRLREFHIFYGPVFSISVWDRSLWYYCVIRMGLLGALCRSTSPSVFSVAHSKELCLSCYPYIIPSALLRSVDPYACTSYSFSLPTSAITAK